MSRRISSLDSSGVAIERDIGSEYDNVKIVADNIIAVTAIGSNVDAILAVDAAAITSAAATAAAAVALTDADQQATAADRVQTGLDRTQTAIDAQATAADRAAVAADLVQTNLDQIATAADRVVTTQDALDTAADAVLTAADRVQTGLDAVATAADRVQTGLDSAATNQDAIDTAADLVQTNLDQIATAADRVQTGLDAAATAADLVQTALDTTATAADRVQTGLDVVSSSTSASTATTQATSATTSATLARDWAEKADGLDVDGVGTRSAKHQANAAAASVALTSADAIATAADRIQTGLDRVQTTADALVATTQAGNASTSAAAALASELAAAASFDSFDDRYLGPFAVAPTLDNDGDALTAGTAYWDTVLESIQYYNGVAWEDPEASAIASASAADAYASAALASKNLAADWSEKGDFDVDGVGTRSAKHHAGLASVSAGTASTDAGQAALSAADAATSATSASDSATAASSSESAASVSEGNALTSENAASASAASAGASATLAGTSATNAANSESAAGTSETNAGVYAASASGSASTASTDATNANLSSQYASEWANKAVDVLVSVGAGGDNLDDYSALHHATKANTSALNAATSESSAATSASNASTSATAAGTSETNAGIAATSAIGSASAASTSEDNAVASASAASTSASNAATSESNAATSASNASTSETNAATSEANAATLYDNFDDRYLGAKAADPGVDNDGATLIVGALYFNSVGTVMKVWDGAAWLVAYSPSNVQTAAEVPYTNTTSGIAASDVQGAVDEVDGRLDTLEADSHTHPNKDILDSLLLENGFYNRTDSAMAVDAGTRTFSLTPTGASFSFNAGGNKYTKTVADTIVFPDIEGTHFIYYDTSGVLQVTQLFSPDIIVLYAFVSLVYWDATNKAVVLLAEERHGNTMDSATHLYNHETAGTQFGSGCAIGNLVVDGNGNSDTHAQLSVGSGSIWDEDIHIQLAERAFPAQIPFLYKLGATGVWRKLPATGYVCTTAGTGRAAYNQDNGGVWQLTESPNNSYILMHLYAFNDVNTPFVWIVGETVFNTANEARGGAEAELLALQTQGMPVVEFKSIATIIVETATANNNSVKSSIVSTGSGAGFIDWRDTKVGLTLTTSQHNHDGTYLPILGKAADSDLLDAQNGTYYLDWTNTTNKPDPTITVNGDATGTVTLTDLTSGTLTLDISSITGNLAITGTVDGRDVSVDGAKLDLIEANAEVNNISDVNATDLTDGGASTLHYHTSDRARANHTGTQTLSTISDAGTVAGYNVGTVSGTIPVLGADNKLNPSLMPDISISAYLGNFTNTTTALANAGVQVSQMGDWFTTDGPATYFVTTTSPTLLSHITQIKTPASDVSSVFGRVGAVAAQTGDYNAAQVTNAFDKSTNTLDNITAGTTNKHFTSSDKTKLDGIETGATADQTGAEIKALYITQPNAFLDADKTKLATIESGATADQTGLEIKTLYEAQLDTNAFTDTEKSKLSGIATSANNYTHPSHPGDDFSVDSGPLTGATVISDIDINVTTDTLGHVTDANGVIATRVLTPANIGAPSGSGTSTGTNTGDNAVNTRYSGLVSNVTTNLGYTTAASTGTVTSSDGTDATIPAATTSLAGLLTSTDKTKLNGIATSANNYVHPTGDGNLHVPATSTTNNGKVLTAGATAGAITWEVPTPAPVTSVAGKTGIVTLAKADVGLTSVDDTSDANKPISTAVQAALDEIEALALAGL